MTSTDWRQYSDQDRHAHECLDWRQIGAAEACVSIALQYLDDDDFREVQHYKMVLARLERARDLLRTIGFTNWAKRKPCRFCGQIRSVDELVSCNCGETWGQ